MYKEWGALPLPIKFKKNKKKRLLKNNNYKNELERVTVQTQTNSPYNHGNVSPKLCLQYVNATAD